ncbi:MAG: hypothetical protein ACXWWG_00535 [Nitrospira sp.]
MPKVKTIWPNQNDPRSVRLGVNQTGCSIQLPPFFNKEFKNGRAMITADDHGVYIMPCDEDMGQKLNCGDNQTTGYQHALLTKGREKLTTQAGGLFRVMACRTMILTQGGLFGLFVEWPPEEHRTPIKLFDRQMSFTRAEAFELWMTMMQHCRTDQEVIQELTKDVELTCKMVRALSGYVAPADCVTVAAE